jgi:hypothetical protein
MKTLQKLVPNSSKVMPMAMAQLQMSVMEQMAQIAQMAQGMMNMGSLAQPGYVPPPMPDAFAAFLACHQARAQNGQVRVQAQIVSASSWSGAMRETDEVESVQQQPGSMEAYNRMLAMCQKQQQQSQPSNSKQ